MASYETTVIVKSNTPEDQVNGLKSKVEGLITAHSGNLANFEDWGTRKFTYNIQGEGRGRYVFFAYTGNNAAVAEIERNLRINESVVRYLSISVDAEDNLELLKTLSPMKKPVARTAVDHFEE